MRLPRADARNPPKNRAAPAVRRQKSFANEQEAEVVRQDEMVEAFSEAARVGSK